MTFLCCTHAVEFHFYTSRKVLIRKVYAYFQPIELENCINYKYDLTDDTQLNVF